MRISKKNVNRLDITRGWIMMLTELQCKIPNMKKPKQVKFKFAFKKKVVNSIFSAFSNKMTTGLINDFIKLLSSR